MSEINESNTEQNIQLDGGTYEILRKRLQSHAHDLNAKLYELNTSRKDVFGSIETKLLDTQRVTTDHNCIPWDIFTLDQKMIFG